MYTIVYYIDRFSYLTLNIDLLDIDAIT